VLIAISGSGNSPNVLHAVEAAKEQGAYTIGLTGYRGGKLAAIAHESIIVPCENMQQIEDMHMILVHLFFSAMRERIAGRV
jgi:D-sedoheptulose 7-phosphate isomerase